MAIGDRIRGIGHGLKDTIVSNGKTFAGHVGTVGMVSMAPQFYLLKQAFPSLGINPSAFSPISGGGGGGDVGRYTSPDFSQDDQSNVNDLQQNVQSSTPDAVSTGQAGNTKASTYSDGLDKEGSRPKHFSDDKIENILLTMNESVKRFEQRSIYLKRKSASLLNDIKQILTVINENIKNTPNVQNRIGGTRVNTRGIELGLLKVSYGINTGNDYLSLMSENIGGIKENIDKLYTENSSIIKLQKEYYESRRITSRESVDNSSFNTNNSNNSFDHNNSNRRRRRRYRYRNNDESYDNNTAGNNQNHLNNHGIDNDDMNSKPKNPGFSLYNLLKKTLVGTAKLPWTLTKGTFSNFINPGINEAFTRAKLALNDRKERLRKKALEEFETAVRTKDPKLIAKTKIKLKKFGISEAITNFMGKGATADEASMMLNRIKKKNDAAVFDTETRDVIINGIPLLLSKILNAISGEDSKYSYESGRTVSSEDYIQDKTIAAKQKHLDLESERKKKWFFFNKNTSDYTRKMQDSMKEVNIASLQAGNASEQIDLYKRTRSGIQAKYDEKGIKDNKDLRRKIKDTKSSRMVDFLTWIPRKTIKSLSDNAKASYVDVKEAFRDAKSALGFKPKPPKEPKYNEIDVPNALTELTKTKRDGTGSSLTGMKELLNNSSLSDKDKFKALRILNDEKSVKKNNSIVSHLNKNNKNKASSIKSKENKIPSLIIETKSIIVNIYNLLSKYFSNINRNRQKQKSYKKDTDVTKIHSLKQQQRYAKKDRKDKELFYKKFNKSSKEIDKLSHSFIAYSKWQRTRKFFEFIGGLVKGGFSIVSNGIKIVASAIGGIGTFLMGGALFKMIRSPFSWLWKNIAAGGSKLFGGLKSFGSKILGKFGLMLTSLQSLGSALGKIGSSLVEKGKQFFDKAKDKAGKFADKAKDKVASVGSKAKSIGSSIMSGASNFFGGIVNKAKSIGGKVVNGIKGVAGGAKGLMKGLFAVGKKVPILGAVLGTGQAIYELTQGNYGRAAAALTAGIASTMPGIGTAVSIGIEGGLIAEELYRKNKENELQSPSIIQNTEEATENTSNQNQIPVTSIEEKTKNETINSNQPQIKTEAIQNQNLNNDIVNVKPKVDSIIENSNRNNDENKNIVENVKFQSNLMDKMDGFINLMKESVYLLKAVAKNTDVDLSQLLSPQVFQDRRQNDILMPAPVFIGNQQTLNNENNNNNNKQRFLNAPDASL